MILLTDTEKACFLLLLFLNIFSFNLFMRDTERERERERDTGRERSRLHAESPMQNSILGFQDHALC